MASLLERMQAPAPGPVRRTSSAASNRSSPYARPEKEKPSADEPWRHDMYESTQTLAGRLSSSTPAHPRASFTNPLAQRAFREAGVVSQDAADAGGFSIRGAGDKGNVVEVSGLAEGTTAADVEAIFKQIGPISGSKSMTGPSAKNVTIRVIYKAPESASQAVAKYHGQTADGNQLSVKIVGIRDTGIVGRLGGSTLSQVKDTGSVDIFMSPAEGESKLRSDALTSDPRAQVLVAPPGTDPKDYIQSRGGGGRRGRGGRGRRGRGGGW